MAQICRSLALAGLLAVAPCAPATAQDDARMLERAREQLETAIRSNPSDFKARTLLGRACGLAGSIEQALEHFRLAAQSGDSGALLLAADLLADREDLPAAADHYESARLAARRSGDTVRAAESELGLAQVELQRGNHHKALEIAERVARQAERPVLARLRPRLQSIQAAARAGQVLREGPLAVWTEGARAREGLLRLLTADESDARVLHALGRFYLEAPAGFGDLERAELLLSRAASVRRHNVAYRAWHVRVLALRGKEAAARAELEAFERAFGSVPPGRVMLERLKQGVPPG